MPATAQRPDGGIICYVDQEACGIRYYGSGFDVIYIGAPIWHMQSEDAKILGDKILEDMGF